MFGAKIRKNITIFHLKMNIFTLVNNCSILHGRICVMTCDVTNTVKVMNDSIPNMSQKKQESQESGVRLYNGPDLYLFILVGCDQSSFVCCLVHRCSTDNLLLLQISSVVVWQSKDLQLSRNTLYPLIPCLCFFIVLKRDLFVYRDDSLTG